MNRQQTVLYYLIVEVCACALLSWASPVDLPHRSLICGLARLDGYPIGVFANDNRFYAGAMSAQASQKVRTARIKI